MSESQPIDDSGLVCPGCGHNLTALTSPVCPECGMRFTIAPASPPSIKLSKLACPSCGQPMQLGRLETKRSFFTMESQLKQDAVKWYIVPGDGRRKSDSQEVRISSPRAKQMVDWCPNCELVLFRLMRKRPLWHWLVRDERKLRDGVAESDEGPEF